MDAARRVCENDSIILQILGYLDRPKLRRIATLERAFFQLAIRVLWRRIWVQELYSLLSGSPFSADYGSAVRHIIADYQPNLFREAYTTEELVASHRRSCPGLITYSQDTLVTFQVPRWKITFHPGRGGIIHHSYDTDFCLADDFDLKSPPPLDPEPVWEGYEVTCAAGMTFSGNYGSDYPLAPKYIKWLSSGRLDPRVVRLRLCSLRVDIQTIGRMLEARTRAGGQPITEMSSESTIPFGRDDFISFAKGAALHVQRLELLTYESQWTRQPLLSTLDLSWLVDVVKDHMPNLTVLHLILTGLPHGSNPPLDQSIPLSTRAYDGKLRRISILLHEYLPFKENPDQVPLFAIARNLACLGAPGCEYELEAHPEGRQSKDLTRLVKYFQRQPLHIRRHLQTVNFESDLFLDRPLLDDLFGLTFTSDGRPIPPCVASLRLRHALWKRLLQFDTRSIYWAIGRLHWPGAERGRKSMHEDVRCSDVVGLAELFRMRSQIVGCMREVERDIHQRGWPISDPDTAGTATVVQA